MASSTLPRCIVLVRLSREWEALRTRPACVARACTWGLGVPIESLDDVLTATGMAPSAADRAAHGVSVRDAASADRANAVLCRLVLAARHDELAARVVLQRLLPGIVAAARRTARRSRTGLAQATEELVASAWSVIRTFPVERRSVHVAAQLLREADYQQYVRPSRRLLVQHPTSAERIEEHLGDDRHVHHVEPQDELLELVDAAALSELDHRLLEMLRAGMPILDIARELEVSERTARNLRRAMISRLRQAAFALAAA